MAGDTDTLTGDETPVPKAEKGAPKAPPRRYIWEGIQPKNPAVYNLYGTLKLRPWAMTDDEIDAVLQKAPDLRRLWKVVSE